MSALAAGYHRAGSGSQVEPFADAIAAMLREEPKAPATVIAHRLRPQGFTGSLRPFLKDHLRRVCPTFTAALAYQRTGYEPGELAQTDWWDPGISVPGGRGQTRPVFGLVTGLTCLLAVQAAGTGRAELHDRPHVTSWILQGAID
jgi:hypothetical protein